MSVCLDGSTLSTLLFSHLNGANQYGFLLGEKIEHIEDKISDSQIHTQNVKSYLYVSSFIPWPSQHCIYNRGGIIDNERLQSFLSSREQKIIGWYSFRHNSTSRPSLRETTLHNNLMASSIFTDQLDDFIFLLCTSSSSADMSIYTSSYGFMQKTDGSFMNLPLTVMNLGDTTRKEYRKKSSTTLTQSQTISGVLQSSQKEFVKSSGEMEHIVKVNHLEQSLNSSLMNVQNKIGESEKTLGSLEMDVAGLRQKLLLLEQEEAELMFHKQEEKRQCELEEQRKHNAQADADEQRQLDKLLKDLGVSSHDVSSNTQSESLTVECPSVDNRNVQINNPALSVSKERAFVKNSDRNTNHVTDSRFDMAFDHGRQINCEQEQSSDKAEVNVNRLRHTRAMKGNTVNTFSFVEDELKFHQGAKSKKQQIKKPCAVNTAEASVTHQIKQPGAVNAVGASVTQQIQQPGAVNTVGPSVTQQIQQPGVVNAAGPSVTQDQNQELTEGPHENCQSKDVLHAGVKPIQNTPNKVFHEDSSDNSDEASVNNELEDMVVLERPQLDPDVCDDKYISSSPVF